MRPLVAITVLALVGLPAGAADDPKDVAKKLEGTYDVIDVLHDGKPEPKKDEIESFLIKGDEIIIKGKGGKDEGPVRFTLGPSKKPAHIDIVPKGDKPVRGIYLTKETDKGLELTIAFTDGPDGERPTDFKGEGKKEIVIKLLRKKK